MVRSPFARFVVVWLLLGLPLTGCSVFGGSGGEETGAAQNQRINDQVAQAIVPLRQEVGELRTQTDDNKREIAVLKTEVEVIKRDVSRRPVITPADGVAGGEPGYPDGAGAGNDPGRGNGGNDGAGTGGVASGDGAAADAVAAAEAERVRRQKAIDERIARERAENDRLIQERAEAERRLREKAEEERVARAKADAERIAREKSEAERAAGEVRERLAREEQEARERAEQERIANEKADAERIAREKSDAEKIARAHAEQERIAREKAEAERIAREKVAAEAAAAKTGDGAGKDPKGAPDEHPAGGTAGGGSTGVTTAKASPSGTPPMQIPADATPEEKAAYLTNQLRTTSDVEAVARQMRDVSHIVAPALVKMLGETDIMAKFRAEKALSFLDPKVVTSLLQDHLKKSSSQLPAIKILGNLGDPQAAGMLTPFLTHENRDLRFYAADSLVKLKDKRAIPYLIEYLKGSDPAKSAIAYDTLCQKTGQRFPFPYFASREEREKQAGPWEQWWKEKGEKFEFK